MVDKLKVLQRQIQVTLKRIIEIKATELTATEAKLILGFSKQYKDMDDKINKYFKSLEK